MNKHNDHEDSPESSKMRSPLDKLRAMEEELLAKHSPKVADRKKYEDKITKPRLPSSPYKPRKNAAKPKYGQTKVFSTTMHLTPRAKRFTDSVGGAQPLIEKLAIQHEKENPALYRNLPIPPEKKPRKSPEKAE